MKGKADLEKCLRAGAAVLALSVLLWTALAPPVAAEKGAAPKTKAKAPAQKAEGKKPAGEPKSGMAGPGKLVPADLDYEGHACSVLVPGDYRLKEFILPDGKVFCFAGEAHPDVKAPVFNITIVPPKKGADLPGERHWIDAMLDHQRTSLKNYKEEKEPLFSTGGHSFKGMSFSGKAADGELRHGFVLISQDKDTFFIVYGQDEEPFSKTALPLLMKSAMGVQIKSAGTAKAAEKTRTEAKVETSGAKKQ